MLYEISCHSKEITDVCFTPLEDYVAVSAADGTVSIHDYIQAIEIIKMDFQAQVTSLELHPDGLIMAIGLSNGKIMIYDIRDMVMAHQLDEPQGSNVAVNKIEFSNKGVFMAACWNE